MIALRAVALSALLAVTALPGCGSAPEAPVPGDSAAVAKDPRAQAAHFAPDATITTVSPNRDGGSREVVRSRDEYIEAELQSHAQTPDSGYTSRIEDIRVAADGASAEARVLAEQAMRQDGRDVRGTAEQVLTIEMRDGRPVVVAVRSTLTGMTVDGQTVF